MNLCFCLLLFIALGILDVPGCLAGRKYTDEEIDREISAVRSGKRIFLETSIIKHGPGTNALPYPPDPVPIPQQDSPMIAKRYSIVNSELNVEKPLCGIYTDHAQPMTSEQQLLKCLRSLDQAVNVTIHGTWIMKGYQLGRMCISSSFALRLPVPSGVASVRDCEYEPINFVGIQFSGFVDVINTEIMEQYRLNRRECSSPYQKDERACHSVIEWGDDMPPRHCRAPPIDCKTQVPNNLFEWSDYIQPNRTNLKLDITPVRLVKEAKGFNFAPGGVRPYWNTGLIEEVRVQMTCSTTGMKRF